MRRTRKTLSRNLTKNISKKTCNTEIKNRFTILLKYFAGVNQMISQLRAFVLFKMKQAFQGTKDLSIFLIQ